jgi:ABC-type sugar transport system ATPase subunit
VSVTYGPITAIENISLTARPGEIIGLLGHNGAGKSTLVNVACGVVSINSGSIFINDVPVSHSSSPRQMQRLGVHVVHQEPAVCLNLSVADNLLLGHSKTGHRRQDLAKAAAALSQVGLSVELSMPTRALGLGGRQLLSIARGLLEDTPRVLFLDEPAASLGQRDAERLHELVYDLAQRGVTVFYVSHRLRDIVQVCHRYIILRDGKLVDDQPMAGLTSRGLAQTLTGTQGNVISKSPKKEPGRVLLSSPLGIEVREGEIVGLFGMAGAEQFEILAQLFGMLPCKGFTWLGQDYRPQSPREAIERGVHMVQADREQDSLLSNMNSRDNVVIPWLGKLPGLRTNSPQNKTARIIYAKSRELFGVVGPSAEAPIGSFSGGNRQKHVLARWIVPKAPQLLLLAQPTQGIDESSKNEIAAALRGLADTGVPILVASAESDEISRICDRAYVLIDGHCHSEVSGDDFDERLLSRLLSQSNVSAK